MMQHKTTPRPADAVTIEVDGLLDGDSAWALRRRIEECLRGSRVVVLDFTRVREFCDLAIAVLAQGLIGPPHGRVVLRGLRTHQARMFGYFGLEAEAAARAS
jgi:anti-anti-sigma regulatory factor